MYRLTASPATIIRVADGAGIPADPLNRDYADYLEWVAEGNTPAPYVAPPPAVPKVVSRYQARAALHQFGLLDTVQALMEDPATPFLARLAWEEVIQFERDSPTIQAMAALLPLTEEQLDQLFTVAASIKA